MDLKWSKYPDIVSESGKNVKNRGTNVKNCQFALFLGIFIWAGISWLGTLHDFLDRRKIFAKYFSLKFQKILKKNFKKFSNFFFFSREIEDEDERLRVYQLDRLKYYYAVCETDSPETADEIYKEFDGQDYGDSGVNGKI